MSSSTKYVVSGHITHKPYNLSKASVYRLDADGRKHNTIFPESIDSVMTFGSVDFVVKDRDGNILSDSRRDRIEKKKEFAELVVKYRQLFDIWEALVKRFGNVKVAKTTLAISDSQRRKPTYFP